MIGHRWFYGAVAASNFSARKRTQQMWLDSCGRSCAQLIGATPAHGRELTRIGMQHLTLSSFQGKPHADISVARSRRADRLGDRQEERLPTSRRIESRLDAQLLRYLTTNRVHRVFARLDMPAGGQPQTSIGGGHTATLGRRHDPPAESRPLGAVTEWTASPAGRCHVFLPASAARSSCAQRQGRRSVRFRRSASKPPGEHHLTRPRSCHQGESHGYENDDGTSFRSNVILIEPHF